MIRVDGVEIVDQYQEWLLQVPALDGDTIGYVILDDVTEADNLKALGSTVQYRTVFLSEVLDY
jgi:hypothetical protein